MANSVNLDQTAPIGAHVTHVRGNLEMIEQLDMIGTPIGAVCSVSTLFASILSSSVMFGNYLQQTTSADDIFRCIFFLAL